MNKRIKKKGAMNFLIDQNNQLWNIVERLEKVVSHNVQATNERLDKVNKDLEAIKKHKKAWFSK
jgi:hypothetical protein|nr:MAG TPA: hypothetical protein [Caudoviricetes sp.]